MYVYYFVHLVGKPSDWANRLEKSRGRLSDLAAAALIGETHDGGSDSLELGLLRQEVSGFLFPVRWACSGLFDSLSGDLSLQPVTSDVTQITLRATYSAPNGAAAEGHRRVEAAVKRFLDSLESLPA